jgi:GNAT superfamily N-acetyltransferase
MYLMYSIINVKSYSGGVESAAAYIHGKWGRKENYPFYLDAITHSSEPGKPLPRFYLLLKGEEICGCYALLTNDLISRQDIYPWLGCLFVEESERGRQLGSLLLKHGMGEAKQLNYSTLYLTTDHDGYYEKYGWRRMEDGYDLLGEPGRIYRIDLV